MKQDYLESIALEVADISSNVKNIDDQLQILISAKFNREFKICE